jgi:hypothetical protein
MGNEEIEISCYPLPTTHLPGAVLRMRPEYGKKLSNFLFIERSARGDFRRIAPRKKQLKSQTGNPV